MGESKRRKQLLGDRYGVVVLNVGKIGVYIGEGLDGATATDDFFRLLSKEWTRDAIIKIPRRVAMHDKLISFTRKINEH